MSIFQILLSFCYHKRLSGYSPGNRFSLSFVILSDLFNFFRQQKNPRNTRFLGYLTFGHKLSYDNKSIFRLYYSMIVATRPDPTVRPPSRYFNPVLLLIFYGFLSKIQWKTADLHHLFWFAWFLGTVLAPENTQTDSLQF